jgi:hypothetical protein
MRRFRAAIADLARGAKITVGVHEDRGAEEHRGPTRATVAQVATAQEFGSRTRAPKSFLRATVDEQRAAIEKALASAGRRAIKSALYGTAESGHVERAFGRVASRVARSVQRRARALELRDTGHLVETIEGRVRGNPALEADAGEEG